MKSSLRKVQVSAANSIDVCGIVAAIHACQRNNSVSYSGIPVKPVCLVIKIGIPCGVLDDYT